MLNIKIQDIDTLYELASVLGVLTYLQSLVHYDIAEGVVGQAPFFEQSNVQTYLLDLQYDTVVKLKHLLTKAGFATAAGNKS